MVTQIQRTVGQWGGMYFEAVGDPQNNNTGGLWHSKFDDISIVNIRGNGIVLKGGETSMNASLPNQFNVFERVRIRRATNGTFCFSSDGQLGQHTFINCEFNGTTFQTEKEVLTGNNLEITPGAVGVVSFVNCSFQNSEFGAYIEGSTNITFDNCWFENVKNSVDIKDSKSINIMNSQFANACGYGSLLEGTGGRCISCRNSSINVKHNYVLVTSNNKNAQGAEFILGIYGNNAINSEDNDFQYPFLSKTRGIRQVISVGTGGVAAIGAKKLLFVNIPFGTINLNRFDSTVSGGEFIFIRPNGNGSLKINNYLANPLLGGNILVPGNNSITINNAQSALFIKIDDPSVSVEPIYQLVSVY